MDTLGEPYITTRPSRPRGQAQDGEPSGLGLGFFIAKTLLERSGAVVTLENQGQAMRGAIARVTWPRAAFEKGPPLGTEVRAATPGADWKRGFV